MKGIALALALGLSLGCGGTRTVAKGEAGEKPAPEPASKPAPAPGVTARIHITMEFDISKSDPPTTRITLIETNETGSNLRHDVGEFEGECKDVTPAVRSGDPKLFMGFHCQPFGEQRGVLVHILHRQSRLIFLRAWLGATKPTFDEFDQILALPPMPTGVPLSTDFD